jgi:hypothetical protein
MAFRSKRSSQRENLDSVGSDAFERSDFLAAAGTLSDWRTPSAEGPATVAIAHQITPTDAEIAMSPKLAVKSPGANDVSCFAVPRQFAPCLASNVIGATLAGSFDISHFEFQNALFPRFRVLWPNNAS